MLVLLLLATPLLASDLSMRNIAEKVEWSAAYATGPGDGIALSVKVSSIQGYHQYLDATWTLNKLFAGASTELPYIQQMLIIDRVGLAFWKEEDLAVGIVFLRTIR